ncbi:inositol-trisphosphate 3-kinase homolog [Copidosoma floridanum]|uniref:inositol-trisphosphate 3-kinase homolog n=1 Tax=Copidosoma floridanum TaxID=29053 RepID=UPI0006C99D01|nr:inositol-trisphosphate 3-kinase homolog [Copidosoma floridanum]
MSSSVCHAPLPARMEAFTTRICLRAVDQYEKILQSHFNKPSNGKESSSSATKEHQRRLKNAAGNVFQWRRNNNNNNSNNNNSNNSRNNSNHSHNNRSSSAGSPRPVHCTILEAIVNNNRTTKCGDNSTGTTINGQTATIATAVAMKAASAWPPSDRVALQKLEQFPLVLSDASMPEEDLSLKFLALNALDLTAPASDVLLKNRLKSWFQLSGHPDDFAPAGPGTVWKRRNGGPDENTERMVYEALSRDETLKDCIPRYYREVEYRGETFIELQDLLFGFTEPHVIDIKLGTRTFLESEVSKTTARPDLYRKMVAVDPSAPRPEEHERGAVTKLRYMQFREEQSSTRSHGFRIEAMKLPGAPPITDLKRVKSHEQVLGTLKLFLGSRKDTRCRLLEKLVELRRRLEQSEYFLTHEVIGSSVFMIYDNDKVGVWLIDFAKTSEVPSGMRLTHRREWQQGNREEGFLLGLDNLISALEEIE